MSDHVTTSVEYQLRHNSGQIRAVLTRIFGVGHIDEIEDAVQEALLKALGVWAINGVPENQTAWLIQVAKNHLFDQFRKQNRLTSFEGEFREADLFAELAENRVYFEDEVSEDQLRMIFACCHPSIPKDSQIALTLKTVGGFNNREIAHAFLAKKTAIDKILVRAKARLKKQRNSFTIPGPDKLSSRLDAVLKVVYLMFNEGYMASEGDELVRKDLCFEAIRLIRLLATNNATNLPKVNALASLLHFQASRLTARTRDDGIPTLLSEQDREEWDQKLIVQGLRFMRASASGLELTEYHLEAEIASHHVLAANFEETDWNSILSSYESLYKLNQSPIIGLNKAFAIGKVHGPEKAISFLSGSEFALLESYYPYYIVLGDLYEQSNDFESSKLAYEKSKEFITNHSVKAFIEAKIASLEIAK